MSAGYPLSPEQRRAWSSGGAARAQLVVETQGELPLDAVRGALARVVQAHAVLRTTYEDVEGIRFPRQIVLPHVEVPCGEVDLGVLDGAALEARMAASADEEATRLLAGREPIRALLLRAGNTRSYLLVTVHPANADGWTLRRLYDELVGRATPEAEIEYAQFADWQNELAEDRDADADAFWAEQRGGDATLPFADGGAAAGTRAVHAFELAGVSPDEIRRVAAASEVTPTELLVASFAAVVARLGGASDTTLLVSADGRGYDELSELWGLVDRWLPIRSRCDARQRAIEVARACARALRRGVESQEHLPDDPSGAAFAFDLAELPARGRIGGADARVRSIDACNERASVRLSCRFDGDRVRAAIHHDTGHLSPSDAAQLGRSWAAALRSLLAAPASLVGALDVLGEPERARILVAWNASERALDPRPVHRLVAERAAQMPDAIAVECAGAHLTYAELDAASNRLAWELVVRGAGPGSRVAVCLPRAPSLVIALLAVLKAGAAYVPMDPAHPAERNRAIAADSGASLVVSESPVALDFADGSQAVRLDASWPTISARSDASLPLEAPPSALAYVIYTSGSTGTPKGVMVHHAGLTNYVEHCVEAYPMRAGEGAPVHSSVAFDMMVTAIFAPLATGGCVRLVPEDRGIEGLEHVVDDGPLGLVKITPAHLEILAQRLSPEARARTARVFVVGGEQLLAETLRPWMESAPGCRVFNEYGPTEAVVGCCVHEARLDPTASGPVPIGRPIRNARLYVLDSELEPVLPRVAGQLAIGGVGVAHGYLGRPDLTAERFLPDPFRGAEGARMYATGDLVRRRADDELEFIGRRDHQVKIRGYRVELGEVEAALSRHPSVREVAVVAREDVAGDRRLVAYVGTGAAEAPALDELRAFLRDRLPEPMIPSAFVPMVALPLTRNGKVDRKALPEPDAQQARSARFVPPRTRAEQILASIWSAVLGAERVGADDDFFGLGGDSILGVQVVARANKAGLRLTPQKLFLHSRLADLASVAEAGALVDSPEPIALGEDDARRVPAWAEDAYPASMLQAGMLFHNELRPEAGEYLDAHSVHLELPFLEDAMREALRAVVARHPILRASFDLASFSEPMLLVHREVDLPLTVTDIRNVDAGRQDELVRNWIVDEVRRPFDVGRAPLFRVFVHRRTDRTFQLTIAEHHAILDGWSVASLMTELFERYVALAEGRAPDPVSPLDTSHREFVAAERAAVRSVETKAFWRERLAGSSLLMLPRLAPPGPPGPPHVCDVEVPDEVWATLKTLARRAAVPPKSVLLAVHLRVMAALGGRRDVLTGVVSHGRPETPDGERVLGLFLNTLPFRIELCRETIAELARRVFDAEVEAMPHQRCPLATIQAEHGGELLETAFTFVHFHVYERIARIAKLLGSEAFENTNFASNALFAVAGARLVVRITMDSARFSAEQCRDVARLYQASLESAARQPSARAAVAPLPESERERVLRAWNDTDVQWPDAPASVDDAIAAQARSTPDAVAVSFEGEQLSHFELDRRANALACWLRGRGVGPESRVGVCAERSVELVIALLGVVRAGAAYVPLEPEYPAARLAYIATDAGLSVALVQRRLQEKVPEIPGAIVLEDALVAAGEYEATPPKHRGGSGLAYVIYTSGSTGNPKGAMNHHAGLKNRLEWMQRAYPLGADDVVLQKTAFGFDVSVWEFFWPLATGARLAFARPGGHRDPEYLSECIRREGVSVVHFVPSMLKQWVDHGSVGECTTLRHVVCSGEALPGPLTRRLLGALRAEVHNLYGPTEAAIDVTRHECAASETVAIEPIGRPIANTRVYVVNDQLEPTPVGVAGELCLGGVQLARGYVARPDLTAERFVPDPFDADASRLYRTGDLARWLPDGTVEFLGRIDHQVKVRGLRIELGEIESVLVRHPAVREAVVVVRDADGDTQLVAYVTAPPGAEPTAASLREHLERVLPPYMVPAAFVMLESLPLTPNGKLDRKALPAAGAVATARRRLVPPRDDLEAKIAAAWSQVLRVDPIGIDDDFFDVGGDSIRAIRVRAKAQSLGIDVPLELLFRHPTIRSLAPALRAAATAAPQRTTPFSLVSEQDRARVPEDVEDAYPLSRTIASLVFESMRSGDYLVYVTSVHLRARFEPERLEAALDRLARRHAILRTSIALRGFSEPLQLVHRSARIPLAIEDLRGVPAEEQEARITSWLRAEARRPFAWGAAPLARVHVHRRTDDTLQLTLSEPMLDGWSVATFMTELGLDVLAGVEPDEAPLASSFRELVALERAAIASPETQDFWGRRLERATIALPPRTSAMAPDEPPVHRPRVPISQELSDRLREVARRHGVPLKSLCLAAHARVIAALSGQPCPVTALVMNGRPEERDGDALLGMFLNLVPCEVDARGTWAEIARRAFEAEIELLPHRRYPLAELHRRRGSPFFDTVFNFTHFHAYEAAAGVEAEWLGGWTSDQYYVGLTAQFRLDFATQRLVLHFECRALDVSLEDAERIAGYYATALESIARDEPLPRVVPEAAQRREILDFNATAAPSSMGPVHVRIAEQARRAPDSVAVVWGDHAITYSELVRRAGLLAGALEAAGAGQGELVAVAVDRSPEMMIALLAVLATGAGYVPLDVGYPRERLAYMLADSGARVLVTQAALEKALPSRSGSVVCIDAAWDELARGPEHTTRREAPPESPAYVLYTSGSTGRPKGVVVPHRALSNFLESMMRRPGLTEGDVLVAVTSLSFDIAALELYLPLVVGARVVIAPREVGSDGRSLLELLRSSGSTAMQATPSTWRLLVEAGWNGEGGLRALVGGEALPPALAEQLAARTPSAWNMYGPTETTIWSAVDEVRDATPMLGPPIANTTLYVLDHDLSPALEGVAGELYIGGLGVAHGYLGRPDLTAERFAADPYGAQGQRLYRTGDRVRRAADGRLEFLGRVDHQVKVRGFRIELGEIEAVLGAHAAIRDAVVVAREDAGGARLVAYWTLAQGASPPSAAELREHVKAALPDYMVPSAFVALESVPLTPNGKVDRKALPAPGEESRAAREYVAPRDSLEELIATTLAELLGLPRVGVDDDFFELGGHSLLAMQLVARLEDGLGIEISIRWLFDAASPAGLAERVRAHAPEPERIDEAAMLALEVARMSPEEVEALLAVES